MSGRMFVVGTGMTAAGYAGQANSLGSKNQTGVSTSTGYASSE